MIAEIDATLMEAKGDDVAWAQTYLRHVTYLRGRVASQGPPAQRVIEQHQLELAGLQVKYRRARLIAGAGVTGMVSLLLWNLLGMPLP